MAAMDDPELVIDEILKACVDPKEKMPVGYKAEGSNLFHRIFPNWAEKFSGKVAKEESEKTSYSLQTTGSIYKPMAEGTTIAGNIRSRMKREDNES